MEEDLPVFYRLKPERFEPASSANSWLGRIVSSYTAPDAGFTPKDPSRFVTDPVKETPIEDVTLTLTGASNNSFSIQLTGVASASRAQDYTSGTTVETSSVSCMRLPNYRKVFDAMKKDAEVRADLASMLKPGGKPCYMIVELMKWTDATFVDEIAMSQGTAGSVKAPISTIASAVAGVPVPVADPEANISVGVSTARKVAGKSKGSNIFAFEYKTVRRSAFSRFKKFTSILEDHGPLVDGGRMFATEEDFDEEGSSARAEDDLKFDMDEDDIVWVDMVDDNLSVDDFCLAFDSDD